MMSRFHDATDDDDGDEDIENEENDHHGRGHGKSKGITFKLLGRDAKGRVETRQLVVPDEVPLAVKLVKAEAALKLEKQKIKEKTLQIDGLLNEEV